MKTQLLLFFIFNIIYIYSFNLRSAKSSQKYDSYAFALQFPSSYCLINKCNSTLTNQLEKNILTIHGLWPSYKNGNKLKACTSGVKIEEDDSKLFDKMKQYWPSFQGPNKNFWEHEYNKHGYCMVEEKDWDDYKDYFNFVIDLYLRDYKDLMKKSFLVGKDKDRRLFVLDHNEIVEKIQKIIPKATIKVNCRNGFLYEIYFYLEKDFSPATKYKITNSCKNAKIFFT